MIRERPNHYSGMAYELESIFRVDSWSNGDDLIEIIESIELKFGDQVVCAYAGIDLCARFGSCSSYLDLPTSDPDVISRILNKREMRQCLNVHGFSNSKPF